MPRLPPLLSAAVTILTAMVLFYRHGHRGPLPAASIRSFPPAMPGHPEVERALRVQGNTVEQVVIFLPLLWVATLYFHGWIPAALGLVWCIGRVIYAIGYMKEANKRGPGFAIAALASLALMMLVDLGRGGQLDGGDGDLIWSHSRTENRSPV